MSSNARNASEPALDDALVAEARSLGLDVTGATPDAMARAVRAEKERLWKIENAEAIAAANEYVEKHGLPLAKYRRW